MPHRFFSRLTLILGAAALFVSGLHAEQEPEYRGIWVDAWGDGIRTASEIDQLVADAQQANVNLIVPQVRRRGDAFYNSSYEPKAVSGSFDPLAYLIQKAHAATPRIEVHAWIVTYPIWASQSSSPPQDHVLNQHPDWLMETQSGETWIGGNYWLDPAHPAVQQHTFDVAMDIISRYDVDGFQLDYVRYPNRDAGYNPVSVERFNERLGRSGSPSPTDTAWLQFRRDAVTELVRRIYLEAIALKPEIKISAATIGQAPGITSTSQWPNSAAYAHRLQDWRAWMEEGILDINMPMFYFDATEWAEAWDRWNIFSKNHKYGRHLAIGPGWYLNTIQDSIVQIRDTRQATSSSHRAEGVIGYQYRVTNNQKIGRSTFFDALARPSAYDSEPTPVFAEKVPVPEMPWKTTPTRGHIKGLVTSGNNGGILDGAIVTVSGPENRSARTDPNGFFGAANLQPGTYTVTASLPGSPYGEQSAEVTVTAGAVADAPIELSVEASAEIVIDNPDAAYSGSWSTSSHTSQYGENYGRAWTTSSPATATYRPYITMPGLYDIHVWYVEGSNRAPDAPYSVHSSAGTDTIMVDQRSGGGTWRLLAEGRHFSEGDAGYVGLSNQAGGDVVIADAVRFTLVEADPDPALFFSEPDVYPGGAAATVAWRTVEPAVVQVEHGLSLSTTSMSPQTAEPSSAHSVQVGDLQPERTYHARLHAEADGKSYASNWFTFTTDPETSIIIDATDPESTFSSGWSISSDPNGWNTYRFASTVAGAATRTATYRPNLPVSGTYDVSVYYLASSNRATNSPHLVSHQAGSETVAVNQQQNSQRWFRIAEAKPFAAGTDGFVRLSNNTGSTGLNVIADGMRFTLIQPAIEHTLETAAEGTGSISRSPEAANYPHDSTVELTATPEAGWVFAGWTGDVESSDNPLTLTLHRDQQVAAVFRRLLQLNAQVSGQGSVRVTPDQESYPAESDVEVLAVPADGWTFVGWSGDITGADNPALLWMDDDKVVVARFGFSYDGWKATHFSDAEQNDESVSGPQADPFSHGMPNLLKYAFGMDPHQPELSRLPKAGLADGKLVLTFHRPVEPSDIEYVVETSTDLADWQPSGDAFAVVAVEKSPDGRTEKVTLQETTASGETRRFVRVRVKEL